LKSATEARWQREGKREAEGETDPRDEVGQLPLRQDVLRPALRDTVRDGELVPLLDERLVDERPFHKVVRDDIDGATVSTVDVLIDKNLSAEREREVRRRKTHKETAEGRVQHREVLLVRLFVNLALVDGTVHGVVRELLVGGDLVQVPR
jgi:hypothetical protein